MNMLERRQAAACDEADGDGSENDQQGKKHQSVVPGGPDSAFSVFCPDKSRDSEMCRGPP
jgi:hypothetical protein